MSTTKTAASPEKAPMRILCVGDEMKLLSVRCEVLKYSGYSAQAATVEGAAELIKKEDFDLIIVAAFLREADKRRVLSAAGDTPTLVLQGIVFAPKLLAAVEATLSN